MTDIVLVFSLSLSLSHLYYDKLVRLELMDEDEDEDEGTKRRRKRRKSHRRLIPHRREESRGEKRSLRETYTTGTEEEAIYKRHRREKKTLFRGTHNELIRCLSFR